MTCCDLDSKVCTISEFGLIGIDKSVCNYNKFLSAKVTEHVYKELEEFAKTESGKDVLQFFGNGYYLQAKNYVGTIRTKSGFTLEILPKSSIREENFNEQRSKQVFIKLLHLLYKLPNYKHVHEANFSRVRNIPVFEIFITMFLDEVEQLIRKGIKSDYILKEENLYYLKSKLLIGEQIKRNFVHKERFYVQYDDYNQNRAENRLIKKTLQVLLRYSTTYENRNRIRQYSEHMKWIEVSSNINKDFRMVKNGRGMEHYTRALIWAKVFLSKESFSSFSGETIAFAILYPMEKLFESFVGWYLQKKYSSLEIEEQYGSVSFVEELYTVRPDFILRKNNKVCCVADAKWKIIDDKSNFSQNDFYQLFAYKHIFGEGKDPIDCLRIFYPKSGFLLEEKVYHFFKSHGHIRIVPLDMEKELEIQSHE